MKTAFKIQFMRIREMWPLLIVMAFSCFMGWWEFLSSVCTVTLIVCMTLRSTLIHDHENEILKTMFTLPVKREYLVICQYILWIFIVLLITLSYMLGKYLTYCWVTLRITGPGVDAAFMASYVYSALIIASGLVGISVAMTWFYCASENFPMEIFNLIAFAYVFVLLLTWNERIYRNPQMILLVASLSVVLLLWSLFASLKAVKTREI